MYHFLFGPSSLCCRFDCCIVPVSVVPRGFAALVWSVCVFRVFVLFAIHVVFEVLCYFLLLPSVLASLVIASRVLSALESVFLVFHCDRPITARV